MMTNGIEVQANIGIAISYEIISGTQPLQSCGLCGAVIQNGDEGGDRRGLQAQSHSRFKVHRLGVEGFICLAQFFQRQAKRPQLGEEAQPDEVFDGELAPSRAFLTVVAKKPLCRPVIKD